MPPLIRGVRLQAGLFLNQRSTSWVSLQQLSSLAVLLMVPPPSPSSIHPTNKRNSMTEIPNSLHAQCTRLTRWLRAKSIRLIAASVMGSGLAVALISCGTISQPLMAPPSIPGATFVGSKACADCHEDKTKDFPTATHARLKAHGKNAENIGCESCHGPGSKHVASGGANGTILNPRKEPQTCFQCHLEVRAKFNLPHTHPVLAGKMSCVDCHNPHKGGAKKGGGTSLMSPNEVCFRCHTAQRGPFVFEHQALREGCTVCHDPHGTVNQRMLLQRNVSLCYKCHFQQQRAGQTASTAVPNQIMHLGDNHTGDLTRGACWSAGCHEAIHGSQTQPRFKY